MKKPPKSELRTSAVVRPFVRPRRQSKALARLKEEFIPRKFSKTIDLGLFLELVKGKPPKDVQVHKAKSKPVMSA